MIGNVTRNSHTLHQPYRDHDVIIKYKDRYVTTRGCNGWKVIIIGCNGWNYDVLIIGSNGPTPPKPLCYHQLSTFCSHWSCAKYQNALLQVFLVGLARLVHRFLRVSHTPTATPRGGMPLQALLGICPINTQNGTPRWLSKCTANPCR